MKTPKKRRPAPGQKGEPNAGELHKEDTSQNRTCKPFVPVWLDDAGLNVHQYRVLSHLWRRGDGTCFPSMTTIAESCRIKRATVCRVIRELEEAGFIVRSKRKAPGIRNANQYSLCIPDGKKGRLGHLLKGPLGAPYKRAVRGTKKVNHRKSGKLKDERADGAVTSSASATCDQRPHATDTARTHTAQREWTEEDAIRKATDIRNSEFARDATCALAIFPPEEIEGWTREWLTKAARKGWHTMHDPNAALRGYLVKTANANSKRRFRGLMDELPDDGEPCF